MSNTMEEAILRPLVESVQPPLLPTFLAFVGFVVFLVFAALTLRGTARRPPRARTSPILEQAAPAPPLPTPAIQYKRAPATVHFPQIKSDYPDVWGIGESLDIVVRIEDPALKEERQIPSLTLFIDSETVPATFARGMTSLRRTFPSAGEHAITVELRLKNESLPRRTQRSIKIVDYRTEIAEVFANFREEASQAIAPIREDATPWEIYDILTGANRNLPPTTLREIVASFEEAKYSNHPVTRATYERMIHALLALERVEL